MNPSEEFDIASTWLTTFSCAVQAASPQAVAAMLVPDGWLKDVLTFTWDTRTLHGHAAISCYLAEAHRLSTARVANVALETDPHLTPRFVQGPDGEQRTLTTGFTYDTWCARGKGYATLVQDPAGCWKAAALAMIVRDLKGHEEPEDVAEDWEADGRPWPDMERERRARIERHPYVLIGASARLA